MTHTEEQRKNGKKLFSYVDESRFNESSARRANITAIGMYVMHAINGVPQGRKYVHACHDIHLELTPEGIDA